ncbi:MAG: YpmA family protein [Bacillota bacterium]
MAPEESAGKLDLLAKKTFNGSPELIRVVDFLNKTLKSKKLMFGLTKDRDTGEMTISIYEI